MDHLLCLACVLNAILQIVIILNKEYSSIECTSKYLYLKARQAKLALLLYCQAMVCFNAKAFTSSPSYPIRDQPSVEVPLTFSTSAKAASLQSPNKVLTCLSVSN